MFWTEADFEDGLLHGQRAAIWTGYKQGKALKELADGAKISIARVSQIVSELNAFQSLLRDIQVWRGGDLSRPISHLKMGASLRNVLTGAWVETVGELHLVLRQSDRRLLRLPNLGRERLRELRALELPVEPDANDDLCSQELLWDDYHQLKLAGIHTRTALQAALMDLDRFDDCLFTTGLLSRLETARLTS